MVINYEFGKAKALVLLIETHLKNINFSINIEKVFNNIAKDKDEYNIKYINLNYKEYLRLNNIYSQDPIISKIYYLKECNYCSLSRDINPLPREYTENLIASYVKHNFPLDKTIIITDLASGYLLQTFNILNKILNLGYNNIKLNLIDNLYKNKDFNCKSNFSKKEYFIKIIKKANNISNFQLTDKFANIVDTFLINQSLNQFISWFQNLNINIFNNIYEYQDYAKNKKEDKINILTTIDYLIDLYPNLYIEWNTLREHSLDQTSLAISLSKKSNTDKDMYPEDILLSKGNKISLEHLKWDYNENKFAK